ncbi:hypothetical protein G7Y89_g10844 [Cudoniella acicularis]|uniref:Endonuclease/exonuclease/phosphatase domain-containing protein n=1 Tax=Cudoniella acicularis TaxID=354080 RepID=A0A8H4RDH9_9HELO|nr:hypothetical protein G7Y89_g10844 [Cudoniella acicularis]
MIAAMSAMLSKIENAPDYSTVMQALTTIQNDLKRNNHHGHKCDTKEVAEAEKAAAVILQETNNIAKASSPSLLRRTLSLIQAQREIAVKITNPSTIENLRAKNPRTLQSHVDRRIGSGASVRVPTYGIIAHGIRTQCTAQTAYRYCAKLHTSKDCPTQAGKETPRKCATCKGPHEAWNNKCPVRKAELAKVKSAYNFRQPYRFVPTRRGTERNNVQALSGTPREGSTVETRPGPGYRRPRKSFGGDLSEHKTQTPKPSRRAMNNTNTLSILQYNVMRSKDIVMATLLRDQNILEYDILAIQEPWRNPFTSTTHNPIPASFYLVFLQDTRDAPARVCFSNKRLDETSSRVIERTRDICTLSIRCLGCEGEEA